MLITCCWSWLAYCAFWSQSVDAMMMFFQDVLQVGRRPVGDSMVLGNRRPKVFRSQ